MKVHWIQFMEKIGLFRFYESSSFESRAIWAPAYHFVRVNWLGQIDPCKIDFPSVSGGITNFAASVPFFELGCERHETEPSDQSRLHNNEVFSFEHQFVLFVVVEDFKFELVRVHLGNCIEVPEPQFA